MGRTARLGRLFALVGVCLALAGVCTVAGLWQLQRYGEKRRANVDLRHGAAAAPVPVGDVLAVGRPAGEPARLRQVTAVGRYQPAGQVLVRQRTVGARAGFLVVTPLRTAGGTLLVVRGFVPAVGAATQSPPAPAPPAGEVTVTGRVYRSEPTEPAGALPAGQVERIDVPGLAHRAGAGPAYGGYVELVSSQPAEAAGLTPMPAPDLANPAGGAVEGQHLAYIVQWFFFALLALAAPVVLPTLDRRARVAAAAEPTGPTQPAASAQPATPAEPVDSAGQPAPLHAG